MTACQIVVSDIVHTRHAGPHNAASHFLRRKGLSLWIDLDRLDDAAAQSRLFSVDRFNLLGFRQADYGVNFKSEAPLIPLADYVRDIGRKVLPDMPLATIHLLTFPRILGAVFNPLSVYVGCDKNNNDVLYIYEVRNTFGDMHSYIGTPHHSATILTAQKIFHVSPFFPLEGVYRLKIRRSEAAITVAMRYSISGHKALTAVLRGGMTALSSRTICHSLYKAGQFPFRTILSIHFEALKLWLKRVRFYKRPSPPGAWSGAVESDKAE